ncbi:hypothetical protein SORBI_3007G163001 [Sorghum bicolor]|uniref:Uncharacterized protein n=1 Tax=Sorghum bicolor TaxID=4558 RepID=A0A1Z5RBB6_SORBI|nr:hypothetical protein SORBI_3007G163001 [Sorghum bicolor]
MGGARRSPRSPPSSVQPPQCLLLLGSLCFFARRNPKCLFGGGDSGGGEARRVDLPVTHFPPSSHGCSPRGFEFNRLARTPLGNGQHHIPSNQIGTLQRLPSSVCSRLQRG